MKKIFSMALAGAMIAGLAATSFAAYTVTLSAPLKYDNDAKRMDLASGTNSIEYGKSAYFQILYSDNALDTYADVERLKVKAKWEMGADLVDSISIVKKNISGNEVYVPFDDNNTPNDDTDDTEESGDGYLVDAGVKSYAYFTEIKLKPSTSVNDSDVIGTLEFTNSKAFVDGATQDKVDNEVDVAFTAFYKNNYNNPTVELNVVSDNVELMKWDTTYAVKFNYDDEVEIAFGGSNGGDNEGTFTVDVSGQGKLLINYNTKLDDAIAAANPNAKIRALNFNNVTFNRTGEFLYEWEDGGYIYQVIDGQLYTMPNATFDGDEYAFNTRTLGSYVFSDIELVNPEIVVETPEVEAPEVNNPGTGAAV